MSVPETMRNVPFNCAYLSGQVSYLDDLPAAGGTRLFTQYGAGVTTVYQAQVSGQQARFQLQGQYGITDRLAVGSYVPVVYSPDDDDGNEVTTGDVGIYAQYKLDQLVPRRLLDLTAQLDLVLPTGKPSGLGDAGRIGARLAVLAYKDFGQLGPGVLGAYGFAAFTARRGPDASGGLAATYEFSNGLAAVAELTEVDASDFSSVALFTPGVIYRGLRPFELALGVPLGLSSGAPDWGVTFKLTYAFAR